MEYKGFIIMESSGHGKAMKGGKIRSSIQVRKPFGNGFLLKKQISFIADDDNKRLQAIVKAKRFVDNYPQQNHL